jgi:hypothetical protein
VEEGVRERLGRHVLPYSLTALFPSKKGGRGARSALSTFFRVALIVSDQRRTLRAPRRDLCSTGLGLALFAQVNPKSPTACGPAMVPDPDALRAQLP